jgi:hypothetical protein
MMVIVTNRSPTGNPALYLEDLGCTWRSDILTENYCTFCRICLANSGILPNTIPRPHPFTLFPRRYVLSFDNSTLCIYIYIVYTLRNADIVFN